MTSFNNFIWLFIFLFRIIICWHFSVGFLFYLIKMTPASVCNTSFFFMWNIKSSDFPWTSCTSVKQTSRTVVGEWGFVLQYCNTFFMQCAAIENKYFTNVSSLIQIRTVLNKWEKIHEKIPRSFSQSSIRNHNGKWIEEIWRQIHKFWLISFE